MPFPVDYSGDWIACDDAQLIDVDPISGAATLEGIHAVKSGEATPQLGVGEGSYGNEAKLVVWYVWTDGIVDYVFAPGDQITDESATVWVVLDKTFRSDSSQWRLTCKQKAT